MVVRMRHTSGHTRNRRSHHAIAARGFSKCPSCGAAGLGHHACTVCGMYRGRQVLNVAKKKAKEEKRAKAKAEAK
ncbi:MAG: 50S ribosomal protein L32 [Parcubacteria group bacterium]|nr:50S ribosomal protein L32 [Parcubacteria group bacterium]MBI3074594.1 50S ribosomal protein L32 [Parcubacteria group bacterium]